MAQMLQMIQGRYLVRRAVDQGGFGTIYLTDDTRLHRTVALKEIQVDEHTEVVSHRSPIHEARMLAQLAPHAHIPTVFDVFLEEQQFYIAMQWIEGKTLDAYRKEIGGPGKPLPFGEFFRLSLQLCRALRFLHERQVPLILRDLKPQNLIVSREGRLYLVDFGSAIDFVPDLVRDQSTCWCSGYTAPEVEHGAAQSSIRTEMYSMGVTLYELLFNRRFVWLDGEGDIQLSAYPSLEDLLRRMTDNDPAGRPQSVKAVESDLKRIRAEVKAHPQEVLEAEREQTERPHMVVFAL